MKKNSMAVLLLLPIIVLSLQNLESQTATALTLPLEKSQAQQDIELAFKQVCAAQEAGSNITGLLNQLNEATDLMAKSENALRKGDKATALNETNAILAIAKTVTSQAKQAETQASNANFNTLILAVIMSVALEMTVILSLLLVWRRFKRRYVKSILAKKPQAANV